MIFAQYLNQLEQEIEAVGEEAESLSFVYRALHKLSFTDFVLKLRIEVSQEDREELKAIQEQLFAHKPAQYIIGSSDFHGLILKRAAEPLLLLWQTAVQTGRLLLLICQAMLLPWQKKMLSPTDSVSLLSNLIAWMQSKENLTSSSPTRLIFQQMRRRKLDSMF